MQQRTMQMSETETRIEQQQKMGHSNEIHSKH